jgi:hypothetical protein
MGPAIAQSLLASIEMLKDGITTLHWDLAAVFQMEVYRPTRLPDGALT